MAAVARAARPMFDGKRRPKSPLFGTDFAGTVEAVSLPHPVWPFFPVARHFIEHAFETDERGVTVCDSVIATPTDT